MDCIFSWDAVECMSAMVVHDKTWARLARVPHRTSSVFVDCSPDGCCIDLIDERRIKVMHVLYSGVYLYL